MTLEQALFTYLTSKTTVTDLVSTRIFGNALPQDTELPAIVTTLISAEHDHHLSSASGIVTARFQIDCLADDYLQAADVAEALRQVLQAYRGSMGDRTVKSTILDVERSFYHAPEDGTDTGIHRKMGEYLVKFTETIPTF